MHVFQLSNYHGDLDRYGPNALLKEETDGSTPLLQRGAESAAQRYESNATSPIFTAFLFGTQGLDLAIPSRREYMVDDACVQDGGSATQINLHKAVQLQTCPKSTTKEVSLDLAFTKTKETFSY
jgi:hypothetical protein